MIFIPKRVKQINLYVLIFSKYFPEEKKKFNDVLALVTTPNQF